MGDGTAGDRRCPHCDEQIRPVATRCHHCLTDLGAEPAARPWFLEHAALVLPVVTFLSVAFQVFKAADYEVNTAVDLVQQSGVSTILLGVVLVQLPLELAVAVLLGCAWTAYRREADGTWRLGTSGALVAVTILLALAISPWVLVAGSLVVLGLTVAICRCTSAATRKGLAIALAVLGAGVFGYLLTKPTIWMSAEELTTTTRGTVVGYVVASDGGWTTVLTPTWTSELRPGANPLLRLPSADVTARRPCALDFSDAKAFTSRWHLRTVPLLRNLLTGHEPARLTPPCPRP